MGAENACEEETAYLDYEDDGLEKARSAKNHNFGSGCDLFGSTAVRGIAFT